MTMGDEQHRMFCRVMSRRSMDYARSALGAWQTFWTERVRWWAQRGVTPLASVLLIGLMLPPTAWADGPIVRQSQCRATWTAPQTNTDGTALLDLKEYRIYVADTPAAASSTLLVPTKVIAAPEADPPALKTGEWLCRGAEAIAVGQKYATISAADFAGNEGPRSAPFPFVSADDVSPQVPTLFQVGAGP